MVRMSFLSKYGIGDPYRLSNTSINTIGLPLPNLRVGVSQWSEYIWAGVLGVSYGKAWNTGYLTLLDLLVAQGYIEVPIFSLGVGYQGGGSPSESPKV